MNANGRRVLVVDDEHNITDLVAMALRYEGFEVEVADNGRAVRPSLERFRPDLLILDVMLPDLDGFEVARRLASERMKVPILFPTARDATEDKVRGLTLGGDDYVAKPFSGRARRTRSGDPAPHERWTLGTFAARLRRPRAGRRHARGPAGRHGDRAHRHRVQTAPVPHDQRPRVPSKPQLLDQVWDYDFGGRANGRDLHQLSAKEDRRHRRAADPHRAGGGVCMLRLPRAE